MKMVKKYMMNHLEQRLTIEKLSQEFCISTTALKPLFKWIGLLLYMIMTEWPIRE